MLVGFVVHEYHVEENIDTIEVCLNLSVPIAVMIDVTLLVADDTAQCELEFQQHISACLLASFTSVSHANRELEIRVT